MRTRQFKALAHGTIVDKIAIYDEDENQIDCCEIQKDLMGREFYAPSNPHDEHGSFFARPKDAIECVKNGFGDIFKESPTSICGLATTCSHHVLRFIDRDYGEELRQRTLTRWKNVKFEYGVMCSYLNINQLDESAISYS